MTPQVSVIIPVHNVEEVFERSLRSLFGQTLDQIEFIFVNDATPDRSMELLDRILNDYPTRRSQVQILEHPVNLGVAAARNTGLRVAKGEYVIHSDSDDWVEPEMYAIMYQKAIKENADMVCCDFYEETLVKTIYRSLNVAEDSTACVKALLSGQMHGNLWNKLVRRSLYTNNQLQIFEGLDMWEDLAMTVRLCCCANKIAILPQAFYHYQYNPASITKSKGENKVYKRLSDMCGNTSVIINFLKENNLEEIYNIEINYLKLSAKSGLLEVDIATWRKTYPEANKHILSHPCFSWNYKISQWFCAHGVTWVYKMRKLIKN